MHKFSLKDLLFDTIILINNGLPIVVLSTTAVHCISLSYGLQYPSRLFGTVLDKRLRWMKHWQLSQEKYVLQFTICGNWRERFVSGCFVCCEHAVICLER